MPIYLYILIGSLIVPLLYSILVKDFIIHWKNFIISTSSIAFLYLFWDVLFTHLKIWGFNKNYCLEYKFLKLPIEEILFFFIIPFCSLLIHYAFYSVLPKVKLSKKITENLTLIILTILAIYALNYYYLAYTTTNSIFLSIMLIIGLKNHFELLQKFYITFLIILIPFIIVNGILTGAITDEPIVWYNNNENLNFRIISIPIEDFGYAFSMLFGNLMIFEELNSKHKNIQHENK